MTEAQCDMAFKLVSELSLYAWAADQYGNSMMAACIRNAASLLEQMVNEAEQLAPKGRPMSERKTALTFEEKITSAYMHYVRKIDQQDIAAMYGVNSGRVNEACLGVRDAMRELDPGWRHMHKMPPLKVVDNG